MTIVLSLVARLPADPGTGPQTEFGQVLSPVWRIVLASILAEVISELTDTEVPALGGADGRKAAVGHGADI